MRRLEYQDYCEYYAKKCKLCGGSKRVQLEPLAGHQIWTACICQQSAALKYRFEQFDVQPPELKYKSWEDFKGWSDQGSIRLKPDSFVKAKAQALTYCFGSSDQTVLRNRKKHLIVHKHLDDGENLIIVGAAKSGRTLIAVLVVKEIFLACRLHNLNISYRYLKSWELQNSARWDNSRDKDHSFLGELIDVDFLVLDDIDLQPIMGHHTTPPDLWSMEGLFGTRRKYNSPMIMICSPLFWDHVTSPSHSDVLAAQWGKEFIALITDQKNTVIHLQKEG